MTKAVFEKLTEQEIKRRNRRVLFFIFAVPVLVVLLSTMMYYLADSNVVEMGTVNRGTLINPPLSLNDLLRQNADSAVLEFDGAIDGVIDGVRDKTSAAIVDGTEPKWTLLLLLEGECGEYCKKLMYLTRQTHTALPKQHKKIRRVLLSDGALNADVRQAMITEYPELEWSTGNPAAVIDALAQAGIQHGDGDFYLVDPAGWLMMQYHAGSLDQDELNALGKDVIRDAKRLIK